MTVFFLIFSGLVFSHSVLFVGNSYTASNGGVAVQVKQIYDSVEADTLFVSEYTVGGASFKDHWNNQTLLSQIETGGWEYIVFQEQSTMPVVNPSQTYLYGDSLADFSTVNGSDPVFFMTWARKSDPFMLEALNLAYSRMGFINDALVAPVGIAFDLVRKLHPEIDPYYSDGAHPSIAGSYLVACVFAKIIYDIDLTVAGVWEPPELTVLEGEYLRIIAAQACEVYEVFDI